MKCLVLLWDVFCIVVRCYFVKGSGNCIFRGEFIILGKMGVLNCKLVRIDIVGNILS